MSRIILILLVINIVSCFIVRCIHGGRMIIEVPREKLISKDGTKAIILLPGAMSQVNFDYRNLPSVAEKSMKANVTILPKYSNLGWSSRRTAKQLDDILKETFTDSAEVYTVSIGDKVVRQMETNKIKKIFAINPCPVPEVLSEEMLSELVFSARLFKIMTFLLGWLAIIPLIKTKVNRYSFALFSDQIWELAVNEDVPPTKAYVTHLVLSEHSESLNNNQILRFYDEYDQKINRLLTMRTKYVKASPGDITDRLGGALLYDKALRELDERPDETEQYIKKLIAAGFIEKIQLNQ